MARPSLSRFALSLALALPATGSAPAREPGPGAVSPDAGPAAPRSSARPRPVLHFTVPAARQEGRARWVADYHDALDEARRRNCPVVLMLSHDASEGFKTVSRRVYAKPEFAALSDQVVLLTAFDGKGHACEEREIDEAPVEWCKLFDLPCAHHRKSHGRMLELFGKKGFENPLHVVLDPDGSELERLQGHLVQQTDLERAVATAQAKLEGAAVPFDAYRQQLATLREILDLRHKKGWGRQIREMHKAADKGEFAPCMQDFVAELEHHLLGEGRDRLEEARLRHESGDPKAAMKMLSALGRDFRDTEVGTEARALRKELGG